jgi:NAD(P)-dependent dehydrogenase (short-subunit alcohol dehydrogenase family)
MAVGLARAGADVALCARSLPDLEASRAAVEALGVRAGAFRMDVLRRASVSEAVAAVSKAFGKIDILVNNAGVNVRKTTLELSEEEWDLVLDTNLKGYFLVAQAVAPHMIRQGRGKIINMASIFGTVGMNNQLAYASSKGGIVMMTKVMAIEWAARGVRVNAIAPGYIETEFVKGLVLQGILDADKLARRTPMGRLGSGEEIAEAAIFLASPAASFITGEILTVDGGWSSYGYV